MTVTWLQEASWEKSSINNASSLEEVTWISVVGMLW